MPLDFTHSRFSLLLATLQRSGYRFECFSGLPSTQEDGARVLLRHDVDRLPARAVALAELEAAAGCMATYFFRVRNGRMPEDAIRRVATLGHEIGYHYEDLADAKGNCARAWDSFRANLDRLRACAVVSSAAMHGRPLSRWDSRDLWSVYDYRSIGISCEAYLDPDWRRWRYFTDTGRAWNRGANVRDLPPSPEAAPRLSNGTTDELVGYLEMQRPCVIISAHPERWAAGGLGWLQVLVQDQGIALIKRVALACGVGAGGRDART